MHTTTITNWAATFSCRPARYLEPSSTEEVSAILRRVRAEGGEVRVVGAGHSPNDCAMVAGARSVVLSLARMGAVHALDAVTGVVVCGGGATLHALNAACSAGGLALPNLGSISDQTIAGALATATHGTGLRQGIMASWVLALELVSGTGEVLQLSRAGDAAAFAAALCSLGVLGVVTRVTLQAVPAFDLRVEEGPAAWDSVLASLPLRAASAPFYRFWWLPHTERVWEWRAHPTPPPLRRQRPAAPGLLGALRAAHAWFWDMGVGYHALQALLRLAQWAPGLVPGINALWAHLYFRLPRTYTARSDLAFNFNCLFKQYVTEWAIPVEALPLALTGLREIIVRHNVRAHFPVEVRFSAGDDVTLSPARGRVTAWVGIIAYRPYGLGDRRHEPYFEEFERLMAGLQGRPHWAKVLSPGLGAAQLAALYPPGAWREFAALRSRLDPSGIFLNSWARRTAPIDAE